MRRKKINTFSDPENDKYSMQRAHNTLEFIRRCHLSSEDLQYVLDVAGPSPVGIYISNSLGLDYETTRGDLDCENFMEHLPIAPDFVICLEIIEHLLSPKYFLKKLSNSTHPDVDLIITYPSRPKFLWTDCHFHEYDKRRFEYLVEQSGWKIVARDKKRIPKPFWKYFTGIRTPLRLIFDMDSMFHLRKKEELNVK